MTSCQPEEQPEPPELEEGQFPPSVVTDEDRRRFRTAVGVAQHLFATEDYDETVMQAARSIYRSDIPT